MFDSLRTIMEGMLRLVTHGSVLVLVIAAMLAMILLTAWFDGRDNTDHQSRTAHPRRQTRHDQTRHRSGEGNLN